MPGCREWKDDNRSSFGNVKVIHYLLLRMVGKIPVPKRQLYMIVHFVVTFPIT